MGRKCRVQRSVTVKALERWLLTTTCGQWTSLRHTPRIKSWHGTLANASAAYTHTSYAHTAWSLTRSVCVCVHVSVCLHFPDALVPPWLLQTVLCARGPINHVWWVWSTLFSLVSLSARSVVQGLAVYYWHHWESRRKCATSGRGAKTANNVLSLVLHLNWAVT